MKQLVLLYQVYSNWCLYNELIFLNYLHLLQVNLHSIGQLVLLYQVYSHWCLYNELIFLIYLHSLQINHHSIILGCSLSIVLLPKYIIIQMSLSLMENILIVKTHSLHYSQIIFNMMKVLDLSLFIISIHRISQSNPSSYYSNATGFSWW